MLPTSIPTAAGLFLIHPRPGVLARCQRWWRWLMEPIRP